ncbi:MAG: SIS domain-containing protein [Actinomycetales bacterium]|nr:SIS domain-containing protein [Actinomycetales bacterium]
MTQVVDTYSRSFLRDAMTICERLDDATVEAVAAVLAEVKAAAGRLFLCGSGGGAGHASHAASDFRKIVGIESYCVTDNVTELTARINDEGWDTCYADWLRASRLRAKDCLFVFSVGGGDAARAISAQLVGAVDYARVVGARVVGVAGRDGGHLARVADACVIIPTVNAASVTTQTEGFQAVIWHLLVGHPLLGADRPKWESVTG